MTKINNNRDNLITMIAISEDIYRTNNRIYELLRGLMANPHELTNIKKSIDNLYEKVTILKNSDIGTPLVEEEKVTVPGLEDMSPKEDIGYEKFLQQQQQTPPEPEEEVVAEEEAEELVVEKPPRTPRKPRKNSRENTRENTRENARGRGPRKPLKNTKKLPSSDVDSI